MTQSRLLTLAGPTAPPSLGTTAFSITWGRRDVPCCCEWPAQLPPHTGNPRHTCWWPQSPSLHAWSRAPSLQCLQEGLCALTASLTPQARQTQHCGSTSAYPCCRPHSHPRRDAWGRCGVTGTRGNHRLWERAGSYWLSPHATAEPSCRAQSVRAGRVTVVPPVLEAPSQPSNMAPVPPLHPPQLNLPNGIHLYAKSPEKSSN